MACALVQKTFLALLDDRVLHAVIAQDFSNLEVDTAA